MDYFLNIISQHLEFAPIIIFFLLILAGFAFPISEDLLVFTGAVISANNPSLKVPLFISLLFGAYLSDLIAYGFLGRFLGLKIFKIKILSKFINQKKIYQISDFYEKYGVFTLFFGRFIPFGVRNALFISAGIGKMNFAKFSIIDFFSCLTSCTLYFLLYFHFGKDIIQQIQNFNIFLFVAFLCVIIGYFLKKKR